MSYARNVSFQIKTGKEKELATLLDASVLPMLRKQTGFKHELAMTQGNRFVGISLWADKSSAETYATAGYPEVLKTLGPVIEGTPKVEGFVVTMSTLGS